MLLIDWRSTEDYDEVMADKQENDRRSEFMDAAERLFRENGIVDTTISSIVKEVNAAKGLFYYYFNSKEDVIDAISEKYRRAFLDKVGEMKPGEDYDERLARFIKNVTASFAELWKSVGGNEVDMSPLNQKSLEEAKKDAAGMLADLLDEGVRLNRLVIRNTKYFAALIIGGLVQLVSDEDTNDVEVRRMIDEILNHYGRNEKQ
ncbi:MAG: TetR/AcrR family transcriptional regulator [Solobacterium sp.]|nr:TetR/AcrR family transcriptional regulator [Solobacterium sp.]